MSWAEDHPEPVYPSWREGWKSLFQGAHDTPCPEAAFGLKGYCDEKCDECEKKPMPADIAEKLGIRPIGAEKPEHNGCDGCRHERVRSNDKPCARCVCNIGEPAPDLWEEAK